MCAVWRRQWTDMGTEPGKQPGSVLLAFLGFGAEAAIWGKLLVLLLPGGAWSSQMLLIIFSSLMWRV